jgi:GAF domain-containing protein
MAGTSPPLPSRPQSTQARLEQLVAAGTLLTSELSLEGVLERTVHIAARVIEARYAAIGVLGPDGRVLESFTTYGITPEERARIGDPPKGHGILGLVIREGRVIRLPDLTRHPDSYGFPPNHPPMRSFLGVPVVGRRGVFGDLYLTEKIGAETFSEEDEHLALLLAAQISAAVENAQLHEESARLLEEVQQLHRSRERFFAMVNHELRNALAATYGWAEMLVRRKDPATVPHAAFEVLDSAEHAVSLINDLLDLSRLDEDRLRPVMREVDPVAAARKTLARMTPAASQKGIAHLPHRREPAGADPGEPAGERHPAWAGAFVRHARVGGGRRPDPVHRPGRGARRAAGRRGAGVRRVRQQGRAGARGGTRASPLPPARPPARGGVAGRGGPRSRRAVRAGAAGRDLKIPSC